MNDAGIEHKAILPEGWARPRGFSHAVSSRGATTIRVSGQLARSGGKPVATGLSLGEQWRLALENLITVVRGAALGPRWRDARGRWAPRETTAWMTPARP